MAAGDGEFRLAGHKLNLLKKRRGNALKISIGEGVVPWLEMVNLGKAGHSYLCLYSWRAKGV
jgi:hypothetical protein